LEWVLAHRGDSGLRWLASLDDVVGRAVAAWGLEPRAVLEGGVTALALECRDAAGRLVVLKACSDPGLCATEVVALRHWAGVPQVPRLLALDERAGVLLMERIVPGTPLRMLPDDSSTLAKIAALLDALHRADGRGSAGQLPSLGERVRLRLKLMPPDLPAAPARRFEQLALDLLRTQPEQVVLHGDLGQNNILDGGPRGLVAIDPRGRLGERAYDAAVFAQKHRVATALIEAAGLARLCGIDPDRAVAWTRIRLASHAGYLLRHNGDVAEAWDALALSLGHEPTPREESGGEKRSQRCLKKTGDLQ
jgi:streptomycin 6-kinase